MLNKSILITFTFLIITCSWMACSEANSSTASKQNQKYFSLKNFFEEEIKDLENQQFQLQKMVGLNGQKEQQQLTDVNWKRELSLFINADINKAAWQDKYQIDSTKQNNELTVIYTALEDKLRTQKIALQFVLNADKPHQIDIEKQSQNVIYQTLEKLSYTPKQAYTIATQQKVKFQTQDEFIIEGKLIKR